MNTKNYPKMLLLLLLAFATSIVFAANVTVNTYDSQGNPIAAKFKVWKGPNYVGEYDAGTSADLVTGNTYTLFAHYESTSTERVTFVVDAAGNTFNFSTTSITFHWSGGYLNYRGSGSWRSFGKTNGEWNTRELFPKDYSGNTMKFQFGYVWNDPRTMEVEMDYSGKTSVEKVVSQLQLLDHNGNPLAGGVARGGYATPTVWFVPGSTNANGLLLDMRDGSNTNLSYEMKYNNTTSWSAQQTSSIYNFQTQLLTLRMQTCAGVPLDGGSPAYGYGTNGGTWWFPGGNTGSSNPGESNAEIFPGTYSFRMQYKATTEFIYSWNFPTDGSTVTWTTTKVTLNYPGTISYGGPTGTSTWFTKPSMELLHGTYKFKFTGAGTTDIVISGCDVTKAAIFVQLKSSTGAGLPNATFSTRFGYGSYTPIGTDNTGNGLVYLFDGSPTNTKVKCEYAGASIEKQQNITVNALFIFNTVNVTADLKDSGNNLLTADSWYYRYGWGSYSTLNNAGEELLPVNVKVKVGYKGATVEKEQNVGNNANFMFNTVNVTADLKDSGNNLLTADSWDYRYGWGSYSTMNNAGEELLPVNVKVKVGYKGASVEKEQNVGANAIYTFNTVNVTADLKDSGNNPLTADSWDYRYGWGSYSTMNNAGEELLPVNVKVKVGYKGASVEKEQNVGTNASYTFNTVNVTADLKDASNNLLTADSWNYRYGWGAYSTLNNAGEELLPVNVKVKVTYNSKTNEKEQNISSNAYYLFYENDLKSSFAEPSSPLTQLGNAYPNPFSSTTTLEFSLDQEQKVILAVYDLKGTLVTTLIDQTLPEGVHKVSWDSRNQNGGFTQQGFYVVKLITARSVDQKTIVKIK